MISSLSSINGLETTGRYLVLLRENAIDSGIRTLRDYTGNRRVARAADFEKNALTAEQLEQTDTTIFDNLGVAVCTLDPEQLQSLHEASDESSPIALIEAERVVYALNAQGLGGLVEQITPRTTTSPAMEYLKGYRDAVDRLVDHLVPTNGVQRMLPSPGIQVLDETTATWGLQITKVVNSKFSGRGIKVAVLDTGFDLTHPDFAGRRMIGKSFIPNQEVQDRNGHGTHCIGTACGPLSPVIPPRYGIGYETEIFVGKVLSNQGSGTDSQILAGIEWAIANGCQIISMSLGARVSLGQPYSGLFEVVADRALRNGTLIIAAAGNESQRHLGIVEPVGHPANCPSIMAVGAIDSQLQVAWFSNAGLNANGGQVDIVAPGAEPGTVGGSRIDVHSSYLMPTRYRRLAGTSMATPHVAGIAALYAEATGATGRVLWNRITQNALRLPLPSVDVGAGLVQAP
ncbi:peptidase S8 and S53 subtilisin kexin sedolisin [Richelia sinica FACHB-800]|uniref:Peptidase S8 and S53 subtilisin kexin sedolisin n=1 Tax=Richelia sinica FACHB-800 TaxID=1357546 RepID=A0A975TBH3_9NOST|nr:S8 family serine peptidase [Richelia sinica]MBD2665493.1 S8 family serine peptidase [Richelia sinica FACHB-800]QXE25639.1 peptidase S8 and S53 subtilisin kexin sedolisin [Richelia sinica FACHB-800]